MTMEGTAARTPLAAGLVAGLAIALLSGCAGAPEPRAEEAPSTEALVFPGAEARARADEAFAKGDLDLALRSYVEAADRDPTDVDSLCKIAAIYAQRNNKALAARAYARAVSIDGRHAVALEGLGLSYFEDRQFEPAREMLDRAVAVDASLWKSHNALGLIADASGDYGAAAEHYAAALAVRPGAPSLLNNRGYSRYLAGDLDAAERDFRSAIAADPAYEQAWHNLGLVFARRGDYETARATLARFTAPHVAANDVGYIAMLKGDYGRAEQLFADAIRLSPRFYPTANENVAELRRRRAAESVAARR